MDIAINHEAALAVLPETPTREQIEAFGYALMGLEPEHGMVDVQTMHHHVDGLYGRSVVIKAGTYLVGLPHKAASFNLCIGDITVWTETGRARFTGVHLVNGTPGAMRVGFAHADTTWLSIHRNDTGTTDTQVLEAALVEHSERLMTQRVQGVLQ